MSEATLTPEQQATQAVARARAEGKAQAETEFQVVFALDEERDAQELAEAIAAGAIWKKKYEDAIAGTPEENPLPDPTGRVIEIPDAKSSPRDILVEARFLNGASDNAAKVMGNLAALNIIIRKAA